MDQKDYEEFAGGIIAIVAIALLALSITGAILFGLTLLPDGRG